jgi:hypothetical protein
MATLVTIGGVDAVTGDATSVSGFTLYGIVSPPLV